MSTVLVVTPILIANWPVITAAITAAVAASGFTMVQEVSSGVSATVANGMTREIIEVEESEVMGVSVGTGERMVVERDGIRATFSRDPRGSLQICMEGRGVSKAELRALGEELLGKVTQQYAYHRIVTELKGRNMTIVNEEMTDQQSVKIRVRNW